MSESMRQLTVRYATAYHWELSPYWRDILDFMRAIGAA